MARYVKALYDFPTTEPGEIALQTGDVVKVTKQVDCNWLKGEIHGKSGNFPSNFVEDLHLPPVANGQKIFQAVRSFPAEVQGDLGFQKGDIVIGTRNIDANWWEGRCGNLTGIFPLTHVIPLDTSSNAASPAVQSQFPPATSTPAPPTQEPPANRGGPLAVVRANMDLTAQLDEELTLHTGDVITVLEIIDSDFCVGECNGKRGQFPIWCVDCIEGNLNAHVPRKDEKRLSKFHKWWEEEGGQLPTVNNNQSPANQTHTQPPAQNQPSATRIAEGASSAMLNGSPAQPTPMSQSQTVRNHIENIKNECNTEPGKSNAASFEKTHRRNKSYTMENISTFDTTVAPYGRTLFPFIAENPNELTFFDNEIVVLIRYVDDQWMEGDINGQRGIFPISYVDIIVDCAHTEPAHADTAPPPGDNQDVAVVDATGNEFFQEFGDDVYGRVLFDFKAESERDLDMVEGDTVTVLRRLNEHWFEARHDNGSVGLCPVSFVELITSDPSPVTEAPPGGKMFPPTTQPPPTETHPYANVPGSASLENRSAAETGNTSVMSSVSSSSAGPTVCDNTPSTSTAGDTFAPPSAGTDTNKPTVIRQNKPSLKPKPLVKPKPPLQKTSSVGAELSQPSAHGAAKKALSVDLEMTGANALEPPPANKRLSMPVFSQKSPVLDSSLDELIRSELHTATGGNTSPAEPKSRTVSTSSSDSLKAVIVGDSVQFRRPGAPDKPGVEPLNAASLTASTGQSQFFGSVAAGHRPVSPGGPSRPVPSRPPPPPPAAHTQPKRPAPARPAGPSLAPAPGKTPLLPASNKVDYGPRPVPQRPAPPRPNVSPRRPGDSLIQFGPDSSTGLQLSLPPGGAEENAVDAEVIADLQNRITETQKDIEKHSSAKQELEQMLLVVDESDRAEIEDNIAFYDANLSGLSQELEQLKVNLCEVSPAFAASELEATRREEEARRRVEQERRKQEEACREREELRQKRVAQRKHVITELVQTERDYLHSLNLVMGVFLAADAERVPGCDLETLFGNMDEVIEVSQKLLTSLETATVGKEFNEQIVGRSFTELKDDMKKVYAPYCRNHDDVLALLSKYEEAGEIQDYFARQVEVMKQQATVFDLGSCLIKPVQRVLKYPLLLNELIQATEEEHEDRQCLLAAISAMTDVAHAINEYKRRKDLVLKYRKDTDLRFSEKIAKIGAHSARKKLNRLTQKMVGVTTVDEDFNREEKKFGTLERGVRTLVRDVSSYLDQLQDAVAAQESVANDISDYYLERSGEKAVRQFCEVHNQIATTLFHEFRDQAEQEVLMPLNRLLVMFQGPNKVIKKRHDKLLDFDNVQSKAKGIKEPAQQKMLEKEVERARNNYAALNAQLLDELPRLYALSLDVVADSVARLAHAQSRFHSLTVGEMYRLLDLPLVLSEGDGNTIEAFNIAHTTAVERLSDLSFIPRSFNPRLEEGGPRKPSRVSKRASTAGAAASPLQEQDSSGAQSDSQRMYVRQMYGAAPGRLFTVSADYSATQMMDVSLPRGTLVGVIKEGDPMGNKERWFVDNGATKGFIPKKFLSAAEAPSPTPTPVSAAPPPAQPLSAATTPSPSRPPGGAAKGGGGDASGAAAPPSGNLMDLSSPTEAPKEKTVLPLDLDFSLTSATTWYGAQPWESPEVVTTVVDWGAANSGGAAMRDEEDPPPSYDDATASPQQQPFPEYFRAVYGFQARSEIEVSMAEGQVVKVIQPHDLDGNTDWWLIEVDGNQGYVPANYLYKYQ